MGKITGFMELQRIQEASQPPKERVHALSRVRARAGRRRGARSRARAAWIAASRSARPAARSTTSFRTGTTSSTGSSGATRSTCCTRRTTFPSSPAASVPAPCEAACTLNINDDPVGIKSIEHFIIDKGWEEGWVVPQPPATKTGKRVAVVGSGPAGLACAQQLARAGHDVVLLEKADRIGGLLRYGIPDFKMEKHLIDRRMAQMSIEGVEFRPGVHVGERCRRRRRSLAEFDAVVLTGGAEAPRDLPVPGRDLAGIHFAMEFLPQQNQRRRRRQGGATRSWPPASTWSSSAAATPAPTASARRIASGAKSITQFELLPQPPEQREQAAGVAVLADQAAHVVVARGRLRARLGGRHQALRGPQRQGREARRRARRMAEGRERRDEDGRGPGHRIRDEGRSRAARDGLRRPGAAKACSSSSASRAIARSNVQADTEDYRTSVPKVFAAGDMRRGQSLVVWAIREGRQCARAVDEFLMGSTELPR